MRKNNRIQERKGAAVVEFAIIAPLLVLLALGMVETSLSLIVSQTSVNAAREGARAASRQVSSSEDVKTVVERYMAANGIEPDLVQVSIRPRDVSNVPSGEPIEVTVRVDASKRYSVLRCQQIVEENAVMLKSGSPERERNDDD